MSGGIKVGKNLITKNVLNKRALAESSLLYILEDDLITPGAKDLILQKKYKCKYIKREELKEIIKVILNDQLDSKKIKEEKTSELINEILKKIV